MDRFGLKTIYDSLLRRRVPKTSWYSGDGATLMSLLGIQVLTGSVLALTYSPAADSAYQSVVYITDHQWLGWFVRSLHYWAAGVTMIMIAFHMFRQMLLGGYKSPREGIWITGVLLLACVVALAFTGYLLRWDERSIYGIRVMLHGVSRIPLMGESLVLLIQGGPELGPQTLTRIYATHVLIVPMTMFALLGYHLYLVILKGTTTKGEREQLVHSADQQREIYDQERESESRGEWFFPITMQKTGVMVTVVLGLTLVATIVLGPAELLPEANLVDDTTASEEWWFWWLSGLIAFLPPAIAGTFTLLIPLLFFIGFLLLPLLDRSPARGVKKRPLWTALIILLIILLLLLSDYRRRSSFTGGPISEPPSVPAGITLSTEAEEGRILFASYGCNSCHAVAGQGRAVAVDLAFLKGRLSQDKIRDYILQPPEGIAMPGYEGRLSDEELIALTEFCHVAQTFPLR